MSEMTPQHPAAPETETDANGLREALAAATPGPWRWSNTSSDVYLFGARQRVVMAFERMGMQGAQPAFCRDGILYPAGKENINGFPDAALIVAAVNALPALLADLDAARERLRVVEGERDAAQLALGEQADIEREAFGRGVAWAMGDDEEAPARLLARAESAEAAHERLRAGVEALRDQWRDRGHIIASPGRPHRTAIEVAVEALDEILAGGGA